MDVRTRILFVAGYVSAGCFLAAPLASDRIRPAHIFLGGVPVWVAFLLIGNALRRYGPVSRARQRTHLMIGGLLGLGFAALFIIGTATWPAAPIRETADGYVDKRGTPRSEDEFRAYSRWSLALIGSGSAVFAFAFSSIPLMGAER